MPNPRILFVDDEETIAANAKALLEKEGFAVCSCTSARDALNEELSIDCLVLDFELPEMSGLELYDKIQAKRGPTPVIFISGYDLTIDHPFLKKPFRFSTLAKEIHTLLRSDQ